MVNYTWDNNGDLTNRGGDTFAWDYEDRMTSATVNSVAITFVYRGDGLRNSRTTGGNTTTFTWDIAGGLPVVLDDGARYVYGAGLVSQVSGVNTYYYMADGLGSTMKTVDATGTVVNGYTYDVYGKKTSSTGSQVNEFDFAGQQTDSTGFQYLRARYMDPETGTFVSRDPLAAGADWTGQNMLYANANPVSLTDPTGQFPCPGCDKVKDVAKGVAGAAASGTAVVGGAVAGGATTAWEDRKAILGQCAAWGASGLVYGAVTGGVGGAAAGAVAGCAMGAASQLISHVENPLIAGSLQCGTWMFGTALGGGGGLAAGAACAAGVGGLLVGGQGHQCALWATAGLVAGAVGLATGGRSGLPAVGAAAGCAAAAVTSGPPKASATGSGGEKGGT